MHFVRSKLRHCRIIRFAQISVCLVFLMTECCCAPRDHNNSNRLITIQFRYLPDSCVICYGSYDWVKLILFYSQIQ